MQSTGHTSTQALSFTLIQGSAMMYAITASCDWHGILVGDRRWAENPRSCINLPQRCQAFTGRSERAQLRVERVAQRVAEEIEGEHGEADGEAGKDGHPRRRLREVHRRAAEHEAPRRGGLLDAEPEKGERGFEEDGLAEERGEHDQVRRH